MSDRGRSSLSLEAISRFEERYGEVRPQDSLDNLTGLLRHFDNLPYENLSKILRWDGGRGGPGLRLPARVMSDHLRLGTGGTCFSLTELLRHLVRRAGFACYPVMAHMRHGPNIHCALRVDAGRRSYLVDPGYLVRRPLPLRADPPPPGEGLPGAPVLAPAGRGPAATPAGIPAGDFDLFTMEPDGPRWRYRFSDVPAPADAFRAHWERSFQQPGLRSLLITSRAADGRRLYLHNHKLRTLGPGGTSNDNLRQTLDRAVEELFGIDPEVTRRAWATLQRERRRWREGKTGPAGAR